MCPPKVGIPSNCIGIYTLVARFLSFLIFIHRGPSDRQIVFYTAPC